MNDTHPKAPGLVRMTLTAALLAAPCLALAQAPAAITPTPSVSPLHPPGQGIQGRPRLSQVIGSRVYNERDQNAGEVDDVLLTVSGPMAIVQVGGFLGLGGRLVSMPIADLRWNAERERLVLPGASKVALEARPAFDYDTARRR